MDKLEEWAKKVQHEKETFSKVESPGLTNQRPLSTLVLSSRLSPFDLATLAKYFLREGPLPGPGGIVRIACETLAELLRKQFPETRITDPSEAFRLLESQGLLCTSNNSKRAARFLALHNLLEEERPSAGTDPLVEMARTVVRKIHADGQPVTASQLEKAKMTILPTGELAEVN